MKILMDENLPHELRPLLMPMHDVFTVAFMGWAGIANGELLRRAASQGFDAILTIDRGYEHQQNVSNLPCSVVLLRARSNRIDDLRTLIADTLTALNSLPPQSLITVG
ncbi:MAG TPA: DUF5615 family PIN-like protein [Tepidisphaeraceae bacterium]|jgi:predicted nuclease of predicted toxin-antitoxin system|nr:DUF5615 family PIN-like protein [Tepidisphaeraceae bacterium]